MFQSFSGSSRRPRQVNLSGQDINPFAASSWTPTASGTQKTLEVVHHERQLRQLERDRLNSCKLIQRAWRGHRTRRKVSNNRRQTWDLLDSQHSDRGCHEEHVLVEELRLLLAFFNHNNYEDILRLGRLCERFLQQIGANRVIDVNTRRRLMLLVGPLLDALCLQPQPSTEAMVQLLTWIVKCNPSAASSYITRYYTILSNLVLEEGFSNQLRGKVQEAFAAPLVERSDIESGHKLLLDAYSSVAFSLLITPDMANKIDDMRVLAKAINIDLLSQSLLQDNSIAILRSMNPESRLWLLSHFICLRNLGSGPRQKPGSIKALSTILSLSASDIFGRVEVSQPATLDKSNEEVESEIPKQALPEFIRNQVISLVNKQNITDLLAKFTSESTESQTSGLGGDDSILSTYALTLLRTFPILGEEIRMWLYQASVTVSGNQIPATKIFWKIMKETSIFDSISTDSKAALNILRKPNVGSNPPEASQEDATRERDWRAILLFLELYAFALRFTDDEEFLSGGVANTNDQTHPISRSRESALPIPDVKLLTVFLKNLSFTMYFHTGDILNDRQDGRALSSYFAASSKVHNATPELPAEDAVKDVKDDRREEIFGTAGMTFDYVRDIVTRVMGMLYERDSRRRFLPPNHWLMTSRFDMESFIPAVVAEEERQHQLTVEGRESEGQGNTREFDPTSQNSGGRTRTAQSRQDMAARNGQKRLRASVLASVGPRLEILQNMPYVIPFKTRVQIFRQLTNQDKFRRRSGNTDPDVWRLLHMPFPGSEANSRHHARIRRDNVLEDAFGQFFNLGEGLKEPIQITFVDKFDNVEAGIDGGGVTKEFLTTVTTEAFLSTKGPGYFVTNDQNLLYPNPASVDQCKDDLRRRGFQVSDIEWNETITELLRRFEFLGRVIGKCLYEGILVDVGFSGFFLLKWASAANTDPAAEFRYQANINELRDLDETLYQGLLQLKNYTGNVESFSLNFTIDDVVSLANEPVRTITRELIPDGANKPVTNENRVLYISLVAHHRLHSQSYLQTKAFLRGLSKIIQPSWISMFNQTELQTLIGGDMAEIDVDDLRRNTEYSGVYAIGDDGLEHPTIKMFWQVMKQLDDQDRRKVLKYVTSTPRSPLLGFSQLNPKFSIRDAGGDEQRLPSASTCINLLKLPRYSSVSTLSEKLLYAVNSGAGFDLS